MSKNFLFQSYLNGDLDEYSLIKKIDEIQSKDIKNSGVIYTPLHIVEHMIELAMPTINDKIIEPSCGHGIFLFGMLEYFRKNYNLKSHNLKEWFLNNVTAVDLASESISELKEILSYYFLKHFGLETLPEDFSNVITSDGLTVKGKFDLAIGNPPYVRVQNLDNEYLSFIRKNFNTCFKGNIDIYYAFVEHYYNLSKRLCFITPNSFLTNVSGKVLLNHIKKSFTHIIDFKDKLVFSDARTYTAIFLLDKTTLSTSFKYANDINQSYSLVDISTLGEKIKINKGNLNVLSGTATLADSVFILRKRDGDKFFIKYLEQEYEIEKEMLAPFIKLTKVKNQVIEQLDYIIYPYDRNLKVIDEIFLKNNYPKCYSYLLTARPRLDMRDKGKVQKYESWYAYGRKQGIHKEVFGKVIVIPQMIGKDCIPQLIDVSDLYSEFGKILFTSGFIIPYDGSEKHDELLSDKFLNYVKIVGKAWPGKTEPYYSLTANQIRSFNV